MSLIVRTTTRLVTGFILIFGLYIVMYGHITPGGGFAGGVILALGLILTLLAFGKRFVDDSALISQDGFKAADVIGASLFLVIALLGYFFTTAGNERAFFANWVPHGSPFSLWSGGMLMFCNFAIGVKVGACLFGVLVTMALFHDRRRGGVPTREE
jgi:multicomponent Na+:H+ antiporter subunit B